MLNSLAFSHAVSRVLLSGFMLVFWVAENEGQCWLCHLVVMKPDTESHPIIVDSMKVGYGLRVYISGNSRRFLWS